MSAAPADRRPYLDWPGPIAFAHRGGAAEVPENTMVGFRHAVELGFRYLETDVQATSDGALLVFHDDDLQRTCGRPGVISELRHNDLASARVGGTEPIPTFDELLEEWPAARLNVDCKSDAAAAPLVTAVRRHDAFDRVCVAAFDHRRLEMLRRLGGPRLCTSSSSREIAVLWALGRRPGGVAAQVPPRRGPLRVVTTRFVRRAHRHGIDVHVWTIDEADEMHRLLDLGVDGIMTDRPTVLRDVLVARGSWTT